MRLHLGCGQNYLEGYVNIDYPLSEHNVQQKSVADKFADLTKLQYKKGSIEEVRLHHVFEHFPRHIACALVSSWNSWLQNGGTLHVEVPDFEKNAKVVLSRVSSQQRKSVALRHIFGSNEAEWATHYEGWTPQRLSYLLRELGFVDQNIITNSWAGLYNFTIVAQKTKDITKAKAARVTKLYLEDFMVDKSASEVTLLDFWLKEYQEQAKKTWAKKSKSA